jgi:hypothetical protein
MRGGWSNRRWRRSAAASERPQFRRKAVRFQGDGEPADEAGNPNAVQTVPIPR